MRWEGLLEAIGLPVRRQLRERDMLTVHLEEALAQDGCAICRRLADREQWSLSILLWEQVNDPGIRAELRASIGFCPDHTRALYRVESGEFGGVGGFAILFADFLREGARRLEAGRPLAVGVGCVECRRHRSAEATYVDLLVGHLEDPTWVARWRPRVRLCLPHSRRAMAQAPDGVQSQLRACEQAAFAGVARELRGADERDVLRSVVAAAELLYGRRPDGELPSAPQLECPLCAREPGEERSLPTALGGSVVFRPPCPWHLPLIGRAVGHREIARAFAEALDQARSIPVPPRAGWWGRGAPDTPQLPTCPICTTVTRWRPIAAAAFWQEVACRAGVAGPLSFCLPHLDLLLGAAPDRRSGAALRQNQVPRLRALASDLDLLLHKLDWNNRGEPKGPEQTSWILAAHCLAGVPRPVEATRLSSRRRRPPRAFFAAEREEDKGGEAP